MAIAYFAARVVDQRTPVWQATAVAAAMILVDPSRSTSPIPAF